MSHARVPDIGGQPIGPAYDTYPHLYSVYGSLAPRNGTTGWDGKQYGGTEVYRYFKREHGARTAAVVSYNQAAYARLVARGLKAEGYRVVTEQVGFALPDFPYTAGGLLLPVVYEHLREPPKSRTACVSVARWEDGRGWVSQGDMNENCFDVPQLAYEP